MRADITKDELIEAMDSLHRQASNRLWQLFRPIVAADHTNVWEDEGARDMAQWVSIRYGISWWKADRWIKAAHALEGLPRTAEALRSGELSVDNVVELTRFARPETEAKLIAWAMRVSTAAIRRKGDLEVRRDVEEARAAERARSCEWWYTEDGTRLCLSADLPAAEGAVVARTIDRVADRIPAMPGEEDPYFVSARRADALVALCSSKIGEDADPDRATVVVHLHSEGGAEIESGPVIHPETARRLLCESRVQAVAEDQAGSVLGLGRISREPSAWMMRQLRYRDQGCTFPGCGSRRFAKAHHIRWWREGGRTDLDNLTLVCFFHHKLVHEHGWVLERAEDGSTRWFRPDGIRYRAGPEPPRTAEVRQANAVARAGLVALR